MSQRNVHIPEEAVKKEEFRIQVFYNKRTRAKHYLVTHDEVGEKYGIIEGFLSAKHVIEYLTRKMK